MSLSVCAWYCTSAILPYKILNDVFLCFYIYNVVYTIFLIIAWKCVSLHTLVVWDTCMLSEAITVTTLNM